MAGRLGGRRILVTGASGALGTGLVKVLREEGAKVAAIGRPRDAEADLVLDAFDLNDEAAAKTTFDSAAGALGGLDGLANIAGGFTWRKVEGADAAAFDDMYRLNLRTAVIACQAALPHLLVSGGAVVNVGAAGALNPGAGMAPYAASKMGVKALTESLAAELKDRRVRVNAVLPTILDTPANRKDMPDADATHWTTVEAAGRVIAFLLSNDAGAITGASLPLTLRG
jgi:NAD(P)-dependent dehydrogenase (short-subunit alcohol dehydrogenase family)